MNYQYHTLLHVQLLLPVCLKPLIYSWIVGIFCKMVPSLFFVTEFIVGLFLLTFIKWKLFQACLAWKAIFINFVFIIGFFNLSKKIIIILLTNEESPHYSSGWLVFSIKKNFIIPLQLESVGFLVSLILMSWSSLRSLFISYIKLFSFT